MNQHLSEQRCVQSSAARTRTLGKITAGLALASAVVLFCGVAAAKVKSNTQVRLPNEHYLGDIDGDGNHDFVIPRGKNVFVTKTNFEANGILFADNGGADISRLVIGDFTTSGREKGKDQICAILTNNTLTCYAISDNKRDMWWWFTQSNFIAADEQAIVGDFDGDTADDIFVYKPSTGDVRMYTRLSTGFFGLMPNFTLGNLATFNRVNKQFRVGEFGQTAGRDDLLMIDPANGQVIRFDTATASSGNKTLWWAFTTNTNVITSSEDFSVANVDGGALDELVVRDRNTGAYRFLSLTYNAGNLTPVTGVSVGQLPTDANAQMFWLRNRGSLDPSTKRDDQLLYRNGQWINTHARQSSTNTYWWSYTQNRLNLDTDQDGDGIKTIHELGGYDTNANGTSDEPLHTYGASPFVKDIFLEIDYMGAAPGEAANLSLRNAALNLAAAEMAKFKINLHPLQGNEVTWQQVLGGAANFNWATHFDPIRTANFPASRQPFFHYCLSGESYRASDGTVGSSGLSRGIPGVDLIVTLGSWAGNGTDNQQTGTLLHELGHLLGLRHGGTENTNNKKNFLSIMNYDYQMNGVRKNGTAQYLYSELATEALNENSLSEPRGVVATAGAGSNTFQTLFGGTWRNVGSTTTPVGIDWNANGSVSGTVSVDINNDGSKGTHAASPQEYPTLQLTFSGSPIGSAGASSANAGLGNPDAAGELTEQEYVARIAPRFAKTAGRNFAPYNYPVPLYQPLILNR